MEKVKKALRVGHEQQQEVRKRGDGSGTTTRWFVMRGQDKGQGLSQVQMTKPSQAEGSLECHAGRPRL